MNVLITGGCGFVGQRLALRLLEAGELDGPGGRQGIGRVTLADLAEPETWTRGLQGNVDVVRCDMLSKEMAALAAGSAMVFHLATVASGEGEADFDKAMSVNLDGTRSLLEAMRGSGMAQRLVFTSTLAAFGLVPGGQDRVGDSTKLLPRTTYGMTKAACELMVNDYSRRGFVDGRSARLPTVVIRAGKPNSAASSFCSGVIREPLYGEDAVLPVAREQPMPLTSYRAVADGIVALGEIDAEALGEDRAVGLPALDVTAGDLVDCSRRLAEKRKGMGRVTERVDPAVARICAGWPVAVDDSRARELGLPSPPGIDAIAAEFIEDYVDVG